MGLCQMLWETQTDWMDSGGEEWSMIQGQGDVTVLGSFFFFSVQRAAQAEQQMDPKWETVSTLSGDS